MHGSLAFLLKIRRWRNLLLLLRLLLLTLAATSSSSVNNPPHHASSGGVSSTDLEKVCSTITYRLLEYLQSRDEKRIRLEEEREKKRMEREAEIELKRLQLIVVMCELIANKCSNKSPSNT